MRKFLMLIVVLAAGLTYWQAESRAELAQRLLLRGLVAQLAPLGTLSYESSTAHFWGSGRVESLRFVPEPAFSERLGLPADAVMSIKELNYRDWKGHGRWPPKVRLRFEALSLPLPEPWPTRFDDGAVDWEYEAETGQLQLGLALEAAKAGSLDGSLDWKLATPRSLTLAALLGGRLHYADAGLAQGARADLAMKLGADAADAEQALARMLWDWLQQKGLPPDAPLRAALLAFARNPTALTLRLDPPGDLRPETLPQFAPADRITALGLSLGTR